ncbi:MAG: winged helix-turn-helix domain-containing protein [Burkholderiales bacterium]|nr:winged helix-turn-helix domain-containing protein [Burkholderiales bacterium]
MDTQADTPTHRTPVWHVIQRSACLALLGALGFSNQKPERRAIERDDATVKQFKCKLRSHDLRIPWFQSISCGARPAARGRLPFRQS